MDKLNVWRIGAVLALTAAIVNTVCAVAAYFDPEGFIAFVNSWSHGIDLGLIRSEKAWTAGDFLKGLVAVSLTGFVSGAIFAAIYNLIVAREEGAKPAA
jgi:hypothetical protein